MNTIVIHYRDADGDLVERYIANPSWNKPDTIEATWLPRGHRVSLQCQRIADAKLLRTGDPLNPYTLAGECRDAKGRLTLDALTWQARDAVRALKVFAFSIRGANPTVRRKLAAFVRTVAQVQDHDDAELIAWMNTLPVTDLSRYLQGHTDHYHALLVAIPVSQLPACRDAAISIARGSSLRPMKTAWLQRIDRDFDEIPAVHRRQMKSDGANGPA